MGYKIILSRQATKDVELLRRSGMLAKTKELLDLMKEDPFKTPPPYEKLLGDLKGMYSRRINIQHRLIYTIIEKEGIIHVLRMWRHYE